jgi:riboflavin kinase/FMN adenylyltransferase
MSTVTTWDPGLDGLGPSVVALGVFDGVHRGHQALIDATCTIAAREGLPAAVVTFDPDPALVLEGPSGTRLLTADEKLRLIRERGVDLVVVVPFTPQLAQWEPERFVDEVLVEALEPRVVVVGPEFRFGARAAGDVQALRAAGERDGFTVEVAEPVTAHGERVSSTRIRGRLAAGDVAGAADLLGRPHRLSGPVRHGRGEGAELLGMPTANIAVDDHAMLPASGVYAGIVTTPDGTRHASAVAVGRPPMFPEARDLLEAHVIGWSGDLYDQTITVEFIDRVRAQRKFDSLDDLAEAMRRDAVLAEEAARASL